MNAVREVGYKTPPDILAIVRKNIEIVLKRGVPMTGRDLHLACDPQGAWGAFQQQLFRMRREGFIGIEKLGHMKFVYRWGEDNVD